MNFNEINKFFFSFWNFTAYKLRKKLNKNFNLSTYFGIHETILTETLTYFNIIKKVPSKSKYFIFFWLSKSTTN